jgi:hypothetical protein
MQITYKEIIQNWTNEQVIEEKIVTLAERVRDIPYGSIGSRDPLDVYTMNKGTCSGKHELLKGLYKELGLEVKDCLIMHRFKQLPVKFPEEINEILERTDIVDPHNYFQVKINNKWLTIDITWDKQLKGLGFPVNENWDGMSDMEIAVAPGGTVYEPEDPIAKKKELINELPEQVQEDRKLFLKKCTEWLNDLRSNNEI